MSLRIFQFTDYRAFLERILEKNKKEWGYRTKFSKASGIQPSVLNRILKSELDFTPEQALNIADFLQMSDLEREYFFEMVAYARAANPTLKKYLHKRLIALKEKHEHLGTRTKTDLPLDSMAAEIYYSNSYYPMVHVLHTIPGFDEPVKISEKLRISKNEAAFFLQNLVKIGLAENNGGRFKPVQRQIHISKEHPLNLINHQNARSRAMENVALNQPHSLHYSDYCSLSVKDFERIKEILLQSIDKSRAIVSPSKEETLAILCLDWFEVN